MASGTKEQKQETELNDSFPYKSLVSHPAWALIDQALTELESNGDIELQTARAYIIGYLLQQFVSGKILPPAFPSDMSQQQLEHLSWQLIYNLPTPKRRQKSMLVRP